MAKPKFNPSLPFEAAPVEGNTKPKFDPGKPFEAAQTVETAKAPEELSALRKATQGALGGFSDELHGGLESAGRVVGVKGLGGPVDKISLAKEGPTVDWDILKAAYETARNKKREDLAKDSNDNPGVSTIAEVGGAIASPINKIAKGMSMLKAGATLGGVTAAGNSNAEDVTGIVKDTAIGVGGGALLGKATGVLADKATPAIQKAGEKISDKAKDLAERFAARALGAERGTFNKFGPKQVKEAGRQALDEGLLTPLSSTDDVIAKNEALKTKAMGQRKEAYDKIDEAKASTFKPLEAAAKAEEKVVGGLNRSYDDTKELVQTLEPHLQNILSRGDDVIPLSKAQELVEALGKKAKFDTTRSTQANQVAKDVYNSVRESINEAANQGAEKIGVKGLRQAIEKANKTYATGAKTSVLLKNKLAREQGNNLIGITDAVTGAGSIGYGATTGDWDTAAGIFLAKKGLQKYGAQNAALALNSVSKTLVGRPRLAELAKKSPAAFQVIVSKFENPSALPKAADNENPEFNLKGKDKWAVSGISKLLEHDKSGTVANEKFLQKLLSMPQGKDLLIKASDLKPGSKPMEDIMTKIKSRVSKEQN